MKSHSMITRSFSTSALLAAITATFAVGSASAAVTTSDFADPSFENDGGLTTMNTDYYQSGGGVLGWDALSTVDAGKWTIRSLDNTGNGRRNGILEDKDSYLASQTTPPAGVDGEQFFTASRADNQSRGIMQYVDTGVGGTSGDVTISIDYWVRELAGGTLSGSVQISYQVFAFNDPSKVGFMNSSNTGGPYDVIRGTNDAGATWVADLNYVSTGGGYTSYDSTSTGTGFQTLSETLSLGATNYQYIGVAVGLLGDSLTGSAGEVGSIDNLVVVPEPGSLALMGLGGLLIARRRRG